MTLRRAPDGGGGGGSERGLVGARCRYVRPVAPGHRRRQGGDGTAEHHWDFALSRVSQTMTSRAAERRHASDHRTLKVHRSTAAERRHRKGRRRGRAERHQSDHQDQPATHHARGTGGHTVSRLSPLASRLSPLASRLSPPTREPRSAESQAGGAIGADSTGGGAGGSSE